MYENITYQQLLERMLSIALEENPDIDTREGSVVWLGQAPAAVELQNLYIELDQILNETFADTASREMLIKRAAERGLSPYPATKAVLKGTFTPVSLEIPIGSRFSLSDLNFITVEKLEDGVYRMECETPGVKGNDYRGTLIPIEYITGLESATLTELLIPGEDEEETEVFRQRYFDSLDAQAFGGNVADYIEKVNAIPGVGGVKVYREWNGEIQPSSFVPPSSYSTWFAGLDSSTPSEIKSWLQAVSSAAEEGLLTVGGAVRLVIIDSTYKEPSELLVSTVQQTIDPASAHAEGLGLAPIGHFVTVAGVENTEIDVSTTITYQTGWEWADVKPYAEQAMDSYFLELAQHWAAEENPLTVRISQIETRLLDCPGVTDVTGTRINGKEENLVLEKDNIPVRGDLVG